MSNEDQQQKTIPVTRASTQERDNAVTRLQVAYSEDRLNEQELEERTGKALNARTQEELAGLFVDLSPQRSELMTQAPSSVAKKSVRSFAILGGFERRGRWVVPENYKVFTMMGGCSLDLTTAQLTAPVTTISVYAVMGGVEIIVPPGIQVELHGIPILGGWSNRATKQQLPANAPILRVRGVAIMGGVEVKE